MSKTFGWYYLLAATLYIVFVVCIACSRFGSVKLGPEQSKPEFSLLSWAAMLFAAGIGIDLMFFSVAEPVTQYMQPPEGAGQTIEAARQAMVWTLFHYGLTGWSMYALMGMALGYFSYRYNLPLTIRSALYPIFWQTDQWAHRPQRRYCGGDRHHLRHRHHPRYRRRAAQLRSERAVRYSGLAGGESGPDCAVGDHRTISVTSGVDKGIRVLSELNVALALGLILFVLFMGDTSFLLNALVLNVGDYVNRFMGMTLNSFAFDRPVEWMKQLDALFLGVVGGLVAVCGPVPGAHFARGAPSASL
ncbi:High-affinity choline uptake protein BetT [Klebsiella pneumoniae]|nr:High-affinity choline uptake protein BetT [Klebsiella pneumoniae]